MLKNLRRIRHIKLYALALIVLATALLLFYFYSYRPDHSPKKVVTAGTPVVFNAPTHAAQSAEKTPSATNAPAANAGGATDTHGSTVSTDSSQWTSSASGAITVKSPAPNSTLKSGDTISGSANVPEINYRLSDNEVGVVAQGTLSVVNGNFSGVLHFTSHGTGGRLDVFSTDDKGVEYNEVQINVGF